MVNVIEIFPSSADILSLDVGGQPAPWDTELAERKEFLREQHHTTTLLEARNYFEKDLSKKNIVIYSALVVYILFFQWRQLPAGRGREI